VSINVGVSDGREVVVNSKTGLIASIVFIAGCGGQYHFTAARGINDHGIIVGFTGNPDGTSDGFVGSDARGYQRLVAPGGEMPGNSTLCQGINNFAQVICVVNDPEFNPLSAFIGSPVKGEGNADSSSHAASTRDIAPSSGAAEWTNKSREELVIPTMRP
jgi:hypothetical protein